MGDYDKPLQLQVRGYCPTCNRVQYLPCIVCKLKKLDSPEAIQHRHEEDKRPVELQLKLKNGDMERYKQMLQLKQQASCNIVSMHNSFVE